MMNINHVGTTLNSPSWFLPASSEDFARDSAEYEYPIFHADTLIGQQQLGFVSSAATDNSDSVGQIGNNLRLEATSSSGNKTGIEQDEHVQQDLDDASSIAEYGLAQNVPSYVNTESVAETDHDGDHIVTPEGSGSNSAKTRSHESGDFGQEADQESQDGRRPCSTNTNRSQLSNNTADAEDDEDDDSSSTSSSSSGASAASEVDSSCQNPTETRPDHFHGPATMADNSVGLDIINNNEKAADLLKALEVKGTLEGILERLGYQKPKEAESRVETSFAGQNCSVKNKHVCTEAGCRKSFHRACELK